MLTSRLRNFASGSHRLWTHCFHRSTTFSVRGPPLSEMAFLRPRMLLPLARPLTPGSPAAIRAWSYIACTRESGRDEHRKEMDLVSFVFEKGEAKSGRSSPGEPLVC